MGDLFPRLEFSGMDVIELNQDELQPPLFSTDSWPCLWLQGYALKRRAFPEKETLQGQEEDGV